MSDYYSVASYGGMLQDERRIGAYLGALRRAVTPDSVVLELGTGTGVVAFAAAQAGARRVFAVEPNEAIDVARRIAAANGLADRVEFFQAYSTKLTLPERADVIISDMRGGLPLLEGHIPAIIDARARLLKPGATMIARSDTLFVAPIEAPEVHQRYVGHWHDNPVGLDMSIARNIVANRPYHHASKPSELLGPPTVLATLDYATIESPNVAVEVELTVERPGVLHGFTAWFESQLDEETTLSGSPELPDLAYGRPYYPLERPILVRASDVIELSYRADLVQSRYLWSWAGAVRGEQTHRFEQSSFNGLELTTHRLARLASDAAVGLSSEGEMVLAALGSLARGDTLIQTARDVRQRFSGRLGSESEALTWVTAVAAEYGGVLDR